MATNVSVHAIGRPGDERVRLRGRVEGDRHVRSVGGQPAVVGEHDRPQLRFDRSGTAQCVLERHRSEIGLADHVEVPADRCDETQREVRLTARDGNLEGDAQVLPFGRDRVDPRSLLGPEQTVERRLEQIGDVAGREYRVTRSISPDSRRRSAPYSASVSNIE